MQLILQDLLDNRRLQAEEPSLGFDSAIPTKERKQNEHHQTTNQALQHMGAVVFPWEALYEFGRMICLGFMVTFGGTLSAGKARGRQTNLNEHGGRHSILSKALGLGRRHQRKGTKGTEFSPNSAKQQKLPPAYGFRLVSKFRVQPPRWTHGETQENGDVLLGRRECNKLTGPCQK